MAGRTPKISSPHRESAKALAARIRARRLARGWSQQKLADEASVAYGTVRAIETSAVIEPGVFTVQSIAIALGVDIGDLVRVNSTRGRKARNADASNRAAARA